MPAKRTKSPTMVEPARTISESDVLIGTAAPLALAAVLEAFAPFELDVVFALVEETLTVVLPLLAGTAEATEALVEEVALLTATAEVTTAGLALATLLAAAAAPTAATAAPREADAEDEVDEEDRAPAAEEVTEEEEEALPASATAEGEDPEAGQVRLNRGVCETEPAPTIPKLGDGSVGRASCKMYQYVFTLPKSKSQPTASQKVCAFATEATPEPSVGPLTGQPVSETQTSLPAATATVSW